MKDIVWRSNMGIELAIAAALGGGAVATAVAGYIVNFAVSAVIGSIFKPKQPGPQPDPGVEQRIAANTKNRIPIFYGNGRARGITTFADITSNNQRMAFILALSEGPIDSIGDVYWDGKRLEFDASGNVTNTIGPDGNEDFLNGNLRIVKAPSGGRSSEMEAFSTRWGTNGFNRSMPNLAYVYVELTYNRDKNVTQLTQNLEFDIRGKTVRSIQSDGTLSTARTFSNNPAECMVDYMLDTTFGAGNILTEADIDLNSYLAWKTFCNTQIDHLAADEVTTVTVARYSTNGFAHSGDTIGTTLSDFTAGAQGQLNYAQGRFNIIIDNVRSSVMSFDEDNIYGTVNINEEGFTSLSNKLTVKFSSENNQYLEEQVILNTPTSAQNPNEPELSRELTMKFINNNVEAERAGSVLINQSRNTQTVTFTTDMRALEVQAGDVITVSNTSAGIANKEFVVLSVTDAAVSANTVSGFTITAREYTATVYADRMITEYNATPNTSFPSPFNIGAITDLVIQSSAQSSAIPTFTLAFTVPTGALVDRVDVYQSTTNSFANATRVDTIASNTTFTQGSTVQYVATGVTPGIYFYFVTAGNSFATSNPSNSATISWAPQVVASGFTLNPEFSKAAVVLSRDAMNNIVLTNGTVSFALLEGADKAALSSAATNAALPNSSWRVISVTTTAGVTVTNTLDLPNNEVDITITAFTGNSAVVVEYAYKDASGGVSTLSSAVDITEAPRGEQGEQGEKGDEGDPGAPGASITGARGAAIFSISRTIDIPATVPFPTDAEVNIALSITTGPVRGDTAIVTYNNASRAFRYNGTTWIVPAAFIDGSLVVADTISSNQIQANSITTDELAANSVTGENIVANTSITSPTIRGGLIQGAVIEAGILLAQQSAFPCDLNVMLTGNRPFTQSAGANPHRIQSSRTINISGKTLSNGAIAAANRILNIDQGTIPTIVNSGVADLTRNWGEWQQVRVQLSLPDDANIRTPGATNVSWPSLTLSNGRVSHTQAAVTNLARPSNASVNTSEFVGTFSYTGDFSQHYYCSARHTFGWCRRHAYDNRRTDVSITFDGYVRLRGNDIAAFSTSWTDGYSNGGTMQIDTYSVSDEQVDPRFYPINQPAFAGDTTTPTYETSVVEGPSPAFIDGAGNLVVTEPDGGTTLIAPTTSVNSVANGIVRDSQLISGNINTVDETLTDAQLMALTLNQRIDRAVGNVSGAGYNLENDPEGIGAAFALGDFDNNQYLYFSEGLGLVLGGTLTAGAVRGGDLVSTEVPDGTDTGAYLDLTTGDLILGGADEYLSFDATTGTLNLSGVNITGAAISGGTVTGATVEGAQIQTWEAATAYVAGDIVIEGTDIYRADNVVPGRATFMASDWQLLTGGISIAQANAIVANTAKVGITQAQANAIIANTAKVGITVAQAAAITANTNKVGITAAQASAIVANTAKVGITPAQASAITANTAKVGITPAQASAITANTAKVGITTQQADDIAANNAKVGITSAQASAITANTAKVGITPAQASAIVANTAKAGNVNTDLGVITSNSGIEITSSDGTNASLPAATNARWGAMTDELVSQIETNNAKITDSGVPAILSNGAVPSLNSGITAAEVRSTISAANATHTHTIANVTGLQTALDGKVDDAQVLTNVPSGAVFTDTQLTDEAVQDIVGGMVTGNTETGITVTYQDTDGTLDFAHGDTSAVVDFNSSSDTSVASLVNNVSFDTYGHVTGYGFLSQSTAANPSVELVVSGGNYGFNVDVQSLMAEVASIGDATIGRAEIETASIGTLFAQTATIENLAATNAVIEVLQSDSISAGTMQSNTFDGTFGSTGTGSNTVSTLTGTGTTGWGLAGDGDAVFSNVTVRGESIVQSSTIGGEAAIPFRQVFAAQTEDSTDTTNVTWTGRVYEGLCQQTGPLTINFSTIQFRTSLGTSITTANTDGLNVTFTVEELNTTGTVIETVVIPAQSVNPSVLTFNGTVLIFGTAFSGLDNVLTMAEGNTLRISLLVERPAGQTWTFGTVGQSLSFTQSGPFTIAPKPAGVSGYLVTDQLDEVALEVAGGLGMKLTRYIIFEGSETSFLNILNDFTLRAGTVLLMRVEWDDTTYPSTNTTDLGDYALIRLSSATEAERLPAPAGSSISANYQVPNAIYTRDGLYVGSLTASQSTLSFSPGYSNFRLDTTNQDAAISNLRMTSLSYEYTG